MTVPRGFEVSLIQQLRTQAPARAVARKEQQRSETAARRAELFRETTLARCRRIALGTAWALRPMRIAKLLPLARLWLADLVSPNPALPDPNVPPEMEEFAGMVHDLSPATLVAAYARGLFPKGHFGPLKWVSPRERCILDLKRFHISRRLRSMMRQEKYSVTFDQDFEAVIKACAGPRSGRWHLTWITPRIMRAYAELHDAGYAHSFEVWNKRGELAGGGYGVAIGGVFFIESQFSRETNTSKIGFTVLNWHLAKWGFALSDNKLPAPTVLQMGFRDVPRATFLEKLAAGVARAGKTGPWLLEAGPKQVADWNPAAGADAH
jgi:leucyl/phenylalanyl-tRNA--protein transferase